MTIQTKNAIEPKLFQFRIDLDGIRPGIWRRIQIASDCTFFDLHVAIQNAMGWLDCHLHEFIVKNLITNESEEIGYSPEQKELQDSVSEWQLFVKDYIEANANFLYIYDFGNDWVHKITFEKLIDPKPGTNYPICTDGAKACPPENVGGVFDYEVFIEAIKNQLHPEHQEMLDWCGGSFDPDDFDPKDRECSDSKEYLKPELWIKS